MNLSLCRWIKGPAGACAYKNLLPPTRQLVTNLPPKALAVFQGRYHFC